MATTDKWKVISMFSALAYTLQLYGFWLFNIISQLAAQMSQQKTFPALDQLNYQLYRVCMYVGIHTRHSRQNDNHWCPLSANKTYTCDIVS